jgi:hypothetical protein
MRQTPGINRRKPYNPIPKAPCTSTIHKHHAEAQPEQLTRQLIVLDDDLLGHRINYLGVEFGGLRSGEANLLGQVIR